jgi:pimeloyl-ACP methyl ester carboxylesterase
MHLCCSGTGSPTIVIEAAASADWLGWQGVQPKLSQSTRVCTYGRAGHGWSQPRAGPRDAEAIARELHALLDQAGVQRPLVLTGHSAGRLYVREYAREFPAEVAGVVLIDSSSPQQIDELPGWRRSYEARRRDMVRQLQWESCESGLDGERLMGNCRNTPSPELQHLARQQAARLTAFGNVPLLIISQDPDRRRGGMTVNAIAELPVWAQEQEALKSHSPLSWRVIAKDSGHGIHHDRPDVIVTQITRLIGYLRGEPTPPFGTTAIE